MDARSPRGGPTCAKNTQLTIMGKMRRSPQTVLYVEDSGDDFVLFKLASSKCGTPFSLQRAADGEEAIAYLSGIGAFAGEPLTINNHTAPNQWKKFTQIHHPGAVAPLPMVSYKDAAKPAKFEELQVLIDQIADVWLAREKVPG